MTMIYGLPDDLAATAQPSEEWIEFLKTTALPEDLSGEIIAARNERNRLLGIYLSSNPPYLSETTVQVTDTTFPNADGTPLPARIYTPAAGDKESLPTLLWFHGGGFAVGSHLADDETLRHICHNSHMTVVSASYRLAPENPFPAAPNDAWSAALFASTLAGGSALYVGGVSAGGNLACVVARRARDRPEAGVAPKGQLLAYPWTCSSRDHSGFPGTLSGFEAYVENEGAPLLSKASVERLEALYGNPDPRDADFSPLWDGRELRGLPRAVVFVAGLDPLRDDGVAYWRALERAQEGGPRLRVYPGLPHAFHRYKQMKSAREYKGHLNEGMQELMGLNATSSRI